MASVESGPNRFGEENSFIFLEIMIGGDCCGEEDDDGRERLVPYIDMILKSG